MRGCSEISRSIHLGYGHAMLLNLFDGLPFYALWPVLAVIGVSWYLLICGGLYLLLHRSRFAATALRWKTQVQATRPDQVRGEVFDGVLSMTMVMLHITIDMESTPSKISPRT